MDIQDKSIAGVKKVDKIEITADLPAFIVGLDWYDGRHEKVAMAFYDMNKEIYPEAYIQLGVMLWYLYCDRAVPKVHKATVSVAAIEYFLSDLLGIGMTQNELAKKYSVSAGSISNRFRDMEDELWDVLDELQMQAEVARTIPAPLDTRMMTERYMADLERALSEQEFESEEELQQFLDTLDFDKLGTPKPRSKRERAQELLYDAWESVGAERVHLAKQALKLYPNSADAYVILAQETAASVEEMREYFYKGMVAGERDLGSDYFRENTGHFWGIIETRPYMRAKQGYAECCWELGDYGEALDHYREMLVLNPGDNQGIRYQLLCLLLEQEEYEEAEELLEKYPEVSAHMAYNRVLVTYAKSGLTKEVDKQLEQAFSTNPYVPDFLLGKKAIPNEPPESIGFGDEDEAIEYAFYHVSLWWREKELLKRLKTLSSLK